jgi:hypothetical protein
LGVLEQNATLVMTDLPEACVIQASVGEAPHAAGQEYPGGTQFEVLCDGTVTMESPLGRAIRLDFGV